MRAKIFDVYQSETFRLFHRSQGVDYVMLVLRLTKVFRDVEKGRLQVQDAGA